MGGQATVLRGRGSTPPQKQMANFSGLFQNILYSFLSLFLIFPMIFIISSILMEHIFSPHIFFLCFPSVSQSSQKKPRPLLKFLQG